MVYTGLNIQSKNAFGIEQTKNRMYIFVLTFQLGIMPNDWEKIDS